MSVQVYSLALYRNRGLVGTQSLAVPPGYTIVLRDIDLYVNGTVGSSWEMRVKDHGTNATLIYFNVGTFTGPVHQQWKGRIVFGTGAAIDLENLGPTGVDLSVNGYLLQGIAPVAIVGAPIP